MNKWGEFMNETDTGLVKQFRRAAISTLENSHETGPHDFSEGEVQEHLYLTYHGNLKFLPNIEQNHQEELAMKVWKEEFNNYREIHQI